MFARPFIDSLNFARNGEELCGEIPVVALPRLHDSLANSDGMLHYAIRGMRVDDRHLLEVVLKGGCHLRCQRCLAEFFYPFEMSSRLQLLTAGELEELDADNDVDAIEALMELDVLELIEDELLLGLPFAPKHPEGGCSVELEGVRHSSNPFAVLASLKKKQS